ncbi:MAG TPA: phenylalanine--tRNA ligase subunit beta [Pyrinomonadaceae bacterium]|nr:phenylalanine--tRNA ligase subunit beta [Pyrinomonadaceae bacterium]
MIISYNWLRELTGLEWEPAELRERLTLAGLEVEGVEEAGGDSVFEIAVLSNRPDWMSHLGVAREVGVMSGRGVRLPEMAPAMIAGRAEEFTSVSVEAPDLCPRFTARVVRGVRVGPSPAWLIERLEAVGLRSINNVADITNFVMLELGQPLHAFDLDKLDERRIVVRLARGGEELRTLDDVGRELDPEMLVIADASRAVAVAGVMGGAETEISETTRNVLIECAYFAPASVRRTSRALGLHTDASDRFERGVDFDGLLRAQARTVSLITELAGGAASEDAIDIFPARIATPTVPLRFSRVRALTGLDVPPQDAVRILSSLGFSAPSGGGNGSAGGGEAVNINSLPDTASMLFTAPTWRTDVTIEEDLVEEVARHYGFDRIEAALAPSSTAGEYRANDNRRRAARRALTACGFDEAINFSFIPAAHDDQFELPAGLVGEDGSRKGGGTSHDSGAQRDDAGISARKNEGGQGEVKGSEGGEMQEGGEDSRFVTLVNPIIEGAARMRASLLPGLLASVRHNFNHGTRDVRLFEAGRVFAAARAGEGRPFERDSLGLVATGGALEEGLASAPRELDFYDLKGAIESAADAMNLPALEFRAARARHLREGQSAEISLEGNSVGFAGRLSEEIAAGYKFRQPVFVAELNFTALLGAPVEPVRYRPLARFPSVVRDITLVADRRMTFEEVRRVARAVGAEHLRGVALVYVYEGERVPEGKRSVTLRLEYRADERTLRDEEVEAEHAEIVRALEARFGAQK